MVEEFMLLANISVAEKIFAEFPEHAILRRHPIPPPSNFEPLVKAANYLASIMDEAVPKMKLEIEFQFYEPNLIFYRLYTGF